MEGLDELVIEDRNATLNTEPTDEEIKETLFYMHPNKALRLYGMHALFFQKFWNTIGNDVIQFVKGW